MKFLHAWVELQASAKTFQKQSPDANSFQLSSLLPPAPLGKGFSSVPLLGWYWEGCFHGHPSLPASCHTKKDSECSTRDYAFYAIMFILHIMQKNIIKIQWMQQDRKSLLLQKPRLSSLLFFFFFFWSGEVVASM